MLVQWKGLPEFECTWESARMIHQRFPEFQLEDKLKLLAGKDGRTPIITYQRRKHRRLNKRKLIGLPEGDYQCQLSGREGRITILVAESWGNKRRTTVIWRGSYLLVERGERAEESSEGESDGDKDQELEIRTGLPEIKYYSTPGRLTRRSTTGSWKYFLDTSICSSVTGNQDSRILSILEKTLVLF